MIGVDPQSFTWNFYEWPDALNDDTVRAVNQTIEREYLFTEPQGYGARHTDGSEVKNITNQNLGTVVNIQNFGASDLLEVENNFQKKYYFHLLKT